MDDNKKNLLSDNELDENQLNKVYGGGMGTNETKPVTAKFLKYGVILKPSLVKYGVPPKPTPRPVPGASVKYGIIAKPQPLYGIVPPSKAGKEETTEPSSPIESQK